MTNKSTKGYTKTKIDIYKLYMESTKPKNAVSEYIKDYGIWDKLPVHDDKLSK